MGFRFPTFLCTTPANASFCSGEYLYRTWFTGQKDTAASLRKVLRFPHGSLLVCCRAGQKLLQLNLITRYQFRQAIYREIVPGDKANHNP